MAPTGQPDSVMVTFDDGATQRLTILRRALPRGTGTALFYRCNWCQKPRRYLYLLTLSRTKLVSDLGLRCQVCAHLRFGSQGCYRSAFSRLWGTRPRYPWDPCAVSHPWLLEEEFGRQQTPAAADLAQAQAADETPAKTSGTVPLEFKDDETGEHFDVVQDGDLARDPSEEPGDETATRSTRVCTQAPPPRGNWSRCSRRH